MSLDLDSNQGEVSIVEKMIIEVDSSDDYVYKEIKRICKAEPQGIFLDEDTYQIIIHGTTFEFTKVFDFLVKQNINWECYKSVTLNQLKGEGYI